MARSSLAVTTVFQATSEANVESGAVGASVTTLRNTFQMVLVLLIGDLHIPYRYIMLGEYLQHSTN